MKIDRENCEAWFLDYYEGNLSKEGVEEMYAFLILNPDMREVFDSYDEVSFSPDPKINFDGKVDLKKSVEVSEGINETNYEEYFVGAVEHVLNDEEKNLLEKFLVQHPDKRGELDLLRKTILEPEAEIVFENKAALKKSVLVTEENFEEYAVAALEGELAADVLVQFNAFLATHPEHQKEIDLFAKTKLQPETEIVFEGKNALKRTPLVITAENFDELAIFSVEGLLNAEEEKVFAAALAKNAEQQKAFALYAQTKLQADVSIVFEDKESLKQEKKDRGGFWWRTEIRFAAAASVVLLLGIFWWNYADKNPADHKVMPLAKNDTSHTNSIKNNLNSNNQNVPNVLANNDSDNNSSVQHSNFNSNGNPVVHNVHLKDQVAVVNVPSGNKTPMTPIAFRGIAPVLHTNYDLQVDFSDAFYNGEDFGTAFVQPAKSISAGQYAMRWMKNKLDHSSDSKEGDEDVYTSIAQNKKDENVSGFDLTSSAVNALGEATGANLHLAKETHGTVLTVGKYKVWLNRK
jgi:hypothetical protein